VAEDLPPNGMASITVHFTTSKDIETWLDREIPRLQQKMILQNVVKYDTV